MIQTVALEGDELALDVQREQTTDDAAIRRLTIEALKIEIAYAVRYEGWGTIAKKKRWFT